MDERSIPHLLKLCSDSHSGGPGGQVLCVCGANGSTPACVELRALLHENDELMLTNDAIKKHNASLEAELKMALWMTGKDRRRCVLIDQSLHGDLTTNEQQELSQLQTEAEAYFDEVAPPPISGALKIHADLFQRLGDENIRLRQENESLREQLKKELDFWSDGKVSIQET